MGGRCQEADLALLMCRYVLGQGKMQIKREYWLWGSRKDRSWVCIHTRAGMYVPSSVCIYPYLTPLPTKSDSFELINSSTFTMETPTVRIHLSVVIHNYCFIQLLSNWHLAEIMVWEGNYIPFCPFPLEIWQRPVSLPPLQPHGHGHLHLETTPPWEMGFFFDLHYYRGKERFMWGCWKTSEGCSRKVHTSSDLGQMTSFISPQFPHLLSQGVSFCLESGE